MPMSSTPTLCSSIAATALSIAPDASILPVGSAPNVLGLITPGSGATPHDGSDTSAFAAASTRCARCWCRTALNNDGSTRPGWLWCLTPSRAYAGELAARTPEHEAMNSVADNSIIYARQQPPRAAAPPAPGPT